MTEEHSKALATPRTDKWFARLLIVAALLIGGSIVAGAIAYWERAEFASALLIAIGGLFGAVAASSNLEARPKADDALNVLSWAFVVVGGILLAAKLWP